jgi:hypothetical protein
MTVNNTHADNMYEEKMTLNKNNVGKMTFAEMI